MLKTFSSFEELWQYCLYCPFCKKKSRDIDISVGPDINLNLISFKIKNDKLILFCTYKSKKIIKYKLDFNIDILSSLYTIDIDSIVTNNNIVLTSDDHLEQVRIADEKDYILKRNFYFYLYSECKLCKSNVNTTDISFNNKYLLNMGIEREFFEIEKYSVTVNYLEDKIDISSNNNYNNCITVPLFDLDLNNNEKLLKQIKYTLIFY